MHAFKPPTMPVVMTEENKRMKYRIIRILLALVVILCISGYAAGQSKQQRQDITDLIQKLKHNDANVRGIAAEKLGKTGNREAVEPLIEALQDPSDRVRQNTAFSLGKLGDKKAVGPLIRSLRDKNSGVRTSAAIALGKLGDLQALEPLITALHDKDRWVRFRSAQALGTLKDPRAIRPLISVAWAKYGGTNQGVIEALRAIGEPVVQLLSHDLESGSEKIRRNAAKLFDYLRVRSSFDILVKALKHEDKVVRAHAASAIGWLKNPLSFEPLMTSLKDDYHRVRMNAIESLRVLGDPRATPALISSLKDSNYEVRREAAYALGYIPDAKAAEPLIRCLNDENKFVRQYAATTLGKLKESRAVKPLIAALHDNHQGVVRAAVQALGEIGNEQAISPLIKHLASSQLNHVVAIALKKLHWTPQTEADTVHMLVAEKKGAKLKAEWKITKKVLLADIESPKYHTIENALMAFIGVGDADIIPVLIDVLNRKGNKTTAEAFLNCRHSELETAARKWAKKHGYKVKPVGGRAPVRWGSW